MASGSVLKPFQPPSVVIKQTDVLIQALLHFGHVHPTGPSTPLITQLEHNQLEDALAKLTLTDQDKDSLQIDPKLKKIVRSNVYDVHSSHHRTRLSVRSWTMAEHVYRHQPCPFPTMARGLFTREHVHPERPPGHGRHCIVARGYDKFFNIDECPSTKWDALKERTKPPYHLTLKTNGCIILIAALTPTDLLVTSKHATISSYLSDQEKSASHSAVADRWVDIHLEKVGMSRAELARELWDASATAVAELTDDDFEEHVIPTPINEMGLNLHGVNLNTPELLTYPPDVVAQCAKRWGMHPTPFTTVNNIQSVMKHIQKIQSDGWEGRQGHLEGVVVRAAPRDANIVENYDHPAASIFWKVKFEEPYLTYREWRELTKKMLHSIETMSAATKKSLPSQTPLSLTDSGEIAKYLNVNVRKIHKPETRLYVHWVVQELLERPNTFELWQKNRGIVATREAFFEWRKSIPAAKIIDQLGSSKSSHADKSGLQMEQQNFDKTLLVPIGIPGCGKTTLAVALKSLITCAHTQSDDITTKKTGPAFIENVKNLLIDDSGPKVVIADKNNHLKNHRETLVQMSSKLREGIQIKTRQKQKDLRETKLIQLDTRLVAIVWDLERYSAAELHQIAAQRIVERGDNHQSLRPELTVGGIEAHDAILWRFLKTFEEFDREINREDQGFHHVIELKFADSLETNLRTICNELKSIVPDVVDDLDLTDKRIEESLQIAKAYKPQIRKDIKMDTTLQKPRYFGIKLDINLANQIEELFQDLSKTDKTINDGLSFFQELRKNNRITPVPHITLVHQNEIQDAAEGEREKFISLWNSYQNQVLSGKNKFRVELGPKLVWNQDVMVIQAKIASSSQQTEGPTPAKDADLEARNDQRYHVTIGTPDEAIRPIEGLHLLNRYFAAHPGSSTQLDQFGSHPHETFQSIDVKKTTIDGVLKGLT